MNYVDPRAPSGGRRHHGTGHQYDISMVEVDTLGSEQKTGKGKRMNDWNRTVQVAEHRIR
jgi:hypothetical protein